MPTMQMRMQMCRYNCEHHSRTCVTSRAAPPTEGSRPDSSVRRMSETSALSTARRALFGRSAGPRAAMERRLEPALAKAAFVAAVLAGDPGERMQR